MPRRVKHAAVLSLFVVFSLCLSAEPVSQLKPSNYVNDFAHVLDPHTAANLNNIAEQLDHKANAQVAIVTVNSLDGDDAFDYAVKLYQQWGIGKKGSDRGVLILYAVKDHKYWTTVGYGLEGILPDGKVGGFGREAVPFLKQGDYSGAISLVTSRIADVIAQDAGIQITNTQPPRAPPDDDLRPQFSIATWIIGIIIFLFLISTSFGRSLLFWMLLSGGGRGRGWGGGGFGGGGGGGGGGFGGFGGGSTGGGGAGGSW
ncbi:MAG TPA: TPM domain-containing protein [Terriglobales bacterium]|nr:TPM domain-containing protein [Terriglobales bacterium]